METLREIEHNLKYDPEYKNTELGDDEEDGVCGGGYVGEEGGWKRGIDEGKRE